MPGNPPSTRRPRPPRPPFRSTPPPPTTDPRHHPTTAIPTARKTKPLIYAVGIAAIVASGAIAGAIVKIAQQNADAQAKRDEYHQQQASGASPTATAMATEVDYRKAIESLETRRAQLLAEKLQFERKIFTLREGQRRKTIAEEERLRKEAARAAAVTEQRNDGLGDGLKQVDVRR